MPIRPLAHSAEGPDIVGPPPPAGAEGGETPTPLRLTRALMIFRLVIVTALLGSAIFVQLFYGRLTSDSLYFIIGITYLLTLFYAVLYWPLRDSRTFVFVQLLIDIIVISLLVLVTGAIDSSFVILYYLIVVTASISLGRASSFALAFLAATIYAVVVVAANGGLIDLSLIFPYAHPPVRNLLYNIALQFFTLELLAALSGYLAVALQSTATRLIQRTQELQRLRALNDSIVRSISSGVVTVDLCGFITFANPPALHLLGSAPEELLGSSIEDHLEYNPAAPQLIISDDVWSREMLMRSAAGGKIDVNVTRSFLIGPDGAAVGKLYVIQDLRELKQLQSQLRLKDRMAAVGEMSAAIAHEIRNPLGAISGSAQMIRKLPGLEDDLRGLMDIIVRESARLSGILENYLSFTRQPEFSPVPANLVLVVSETVALLQNSPEVGPDHRISFASSIGELTANVDPNMIKQMIYNLVTNGIKAMPGHGTLEITLDRRDGDFPGGAAVFEVSDSGLGMDAEQLHHLFQPFYSNRPGGIGLGMAIVYRIVQEHGGLIDVLSSPGRGTRVAVALALAGAARDRFAVKVSAEDPG